MAAASTFNPLARPGGPAGILQPGRPSASTLAANPLFSLGYRLTLLCVFILVGRMPEVTVVLLGSSLYQVTLLITILLPLAIITGVVVKVGATRIGMFWTAFHLWVMLTLPLSGYRMGSLETFSGLMRLLPITFYVGGFFVRSIEMLRKGTWAMAWAGIAGLAWMEHTGVVEGEDRFSSVGTFGNSNLLAIYLLMMVPFWGIITANSRYRWITRLFFAGAILAALSMVLKTGSRSGLLSIFVLAVPLFFSLSVANKFKFTVLATLGVIVALGTMPDTLKSRLGTLFSSERKDEISAEALGSADARYALLIESLQTTMSHPFFGTGLGVYTDVAAREKELRGERALWQVTHNMYTQISAETGIPGFILYMTALILAIKETWRVRKLTKGDPGLYELRLIASGLLMSYAMFLFNGCFTSMATDFTFYSLMGFSIATSFVYQQLVNQKADADSLDKPAPAAPTPQPGYYRSPRTLPPPPVSANVPATNGANDDAPWRRNPRKYPPKPGSPSR